MTTQKKASKKVAKKTAEADKGAVNKAEVDKANEQRNKQ